MKCPSSPPATHAPASSAPAAPRKRKRRFVPNGLTIARVFLAVLFFACLHWYGGPGTDTDAALPLCAAVFVLAAVTDALDGLLARRWHVETTFGRIMDPFADKLLVLGGLIFLCDAKFAGGGACRPWMVVVVLGRELLVTGIRNEIEGRGVQFGSMLSGKLKMVFQTVAVPASVLLTWEGGELALRLRSAVMIATVVVTALSGWPYISAAVRVFRDSDHDA